MENQLKSKTIADFIANELNSRVFDNEDYSLNGLQLDFADNVTKLAASVDTGLGIIEASASLGCQALIVHHGIFWKKSAQLHNLRQIVECAAKHKISIIAQHLPLDACATYGNNFSIARLIELENVTPSALLGNNKIGCVGINSNKLSFDQLRVNLEQKLTGDKFNTYSLNFGPKIPERICIVSGSGCDELYRFDIDNFDTLITGEPRQFIYHFCKDNKLNVICAGHYLTETLGVKNITRAAAEEFSCQWEFIDQPTGI